MKRNTKIITLALSLAMLLCAVVCFTASAETAAPEVVAKNVKVDGNFCLMFAVDPDTVAGDDVTLKIYAETPAEDVSPIYTITKAKTDVTLICLDADSQIDDPAIVFETAGVSAKDIADQWYYTVESAGVVSDVATYSVREYAFERLYGDNKIAAEDDYGIRQREFYLSILEVGSTAQDLLVNTKLVAEGKAPERLANEYAYAAILGGNFGDTNQMFVEIGDMLSLYSSGAAYAFKVTTYGTNGVMLDTKVAYSGTAIEVKGNTVVIPDPNYGKTPGQYFAEIGDPNLNFNGDIAKLTNVGIYTNLATSAAANTHGNYSFVDADGRGKVLNLKKDGITETGGGSIRVPIVDKTNGKGNCVVAEFDVKFNGEFLFNDGEYKNKFIGTAINIVLGLSEARVDESYSWKAAGTATKQVSSSAFYMIDETKTQNSDKSQVAGGEYMSMTNSYSNTAKYKLELNKWYNVCIEWYDNPVNNRVEVKAYIDGELFYTTYGNYTTSNTTSNVEEYDYNYIREAKTLKLTLQDRFRPSEANVDNLVVSLIEKELVK